MCLICEGKISEVKKLYCSGCTGLTEIPVIPELKTLDCFNCKRLTTLPIIPGLKDFPKSIFFSKELIEINKLKNF
mgnify:CR=1 FL=1